MAKEQETKLKQTEIGEIPKDWEVVRLGEKADIKMGQSPPSDTYNLIGKGLPFFQGRTDFGSIHPTTTTWCSEPKKKADKGDILLSVRAPIGDLNISDKECCIGRGLSALSWKNKHNKFLFYLMKYNQKRLESDFESGGTVFGCVGKDGLSNFFIAIPKNESEQFTIAKILSSLDSKIELLQKQNQILEKIGQELFKHWFVDFEFPNENGKPYKSSGGEMVESELGEIPKGWEVKALDKIADFLNGLALQKFPAKGKDYLPAIKIRELNQGITEASDKVSPDIDENYIVKNGDILFAWSGSLCVLIWGGGKGALNQHLFKVTSKNFEKWFYYYWTKYHLQKFIGIAEDKATTMGHIKREHLSESKVLVPDDKTLGIMDQIMNPILRKIIINKESLIDISKIRDSLLPKLMSGKIRVPVEVRA